MLVVAGAVGLAIMLRPGGRSGVSQFAGQLEAFLKGLPNRPANERVANLVIFPEESQGSLLALAEFEAPAPAPSDEVRTFVRELQAADDRFLAASVPRPGTRASTAAREEIKRAILAVNEAGLETNIVALGSAAGEAAKALKEVEGQIRGGYPVGINKFVTLGANRPALKRLAPLAFAENPGGPNNILETASLYAVHPKGPPRLELEFAKRGGRTTLFPGAVFFGANAEVTGKLLAQRIAALIADPRPLAVALELVQAKPAADQRPPQERTEPGNDPAKTLPGMADSQEYRSYRSVADGRVREHGEGRDSRDGTEGSDSLFFIKGGEEYQGTGTEIKTGKVAGEIDDSLYEAHMKCHGGPAAFPISNCCKEMLKKTGGKAHSKELNIREYLSWYGPHRRSQGLNDTGNLPYGVSVCTAEGIVDLFRTRLCRDRHKAMMGSCLRKRGMDYDPKLLFKEDLDLYTYNSDIQHFQGGQ